MIIVIEVCGIVAFLLLTFLWRNDWTGFLPLLGVAVITGQMYYLDLPRLRKLTRP